MKITKTHYNVMKTACDKVIKDNPNMKEEYSNKGLSPMRYRWDVWNMSSNMLPFTCNTLYKYLDDTHIDTALRSICE